MIISSWKTSLVGLGLRLRLRHGDWYAEVEDLVGRNLASKGYFRWRIKVELQWELRYWDCGCQACLSEPTLLLDHLLIKPFSFSECSFTTSFLLSSHLDHTGMDSALYILCLSFQEALSRIALTTRKTGNSTPSIFSSSTVERSGTRKASTTHRFQDPPQSLKTPSPENLKRSRRLLQEAGFQDEMI